MIEAFKMAAEAMTHGRALEIATYGNFSAAAWGTLPTETYLLMGTGAQITNSPFTLNAAKTYYFVIQHAIGAAGVSLYMDEVVMASIDDNGHTDIGRATWRVGATLAYAVSTGWKRASFFAGGNSPLESLTPAADRIVYYTSATAAALAPLTSFARTILDDIDAATMRATMGAQATVTGGATTILTANLTVSRALVSDVSGKVAVSAATAAEVGYLSGVSSSIQTQLNGKQASLGFTPEDTAKKNLANGYAGLDASGKIDVGQLPALAITDTFVVASQAAMLALSAAEVGDIAVRTDLNKSFILKTAGYATLANWQELLTPTGGVTSVAGKTGAVTLLPTDVGAQPVDATLTALAGVTTAADRIIYFSGVDVAQVATLTPFARTLLDDLDAASMLATIGALGATANAASATKWAVSRTLTLTGGATGSASIDGSANVSLAVTVPDNSHAHTIANVTGLQAALDARAMNGGGYVNFGGNSNAITTAEFVTLLTSLGAFTSNGYWAARGSWSYAVNQIINDTGLGNIHLAGTFVEVIGTATAYTIRITTATTTSSGVVNSEFIYVNNGSTYAPGWRKSFNSATPPTAAQVGALAIGGSGGTYTFDNWVRTSGGTGWYNATYGIGMYAIDATWVRTFNNAKFYVDNTAGDAINTAGGIYATGNASVADCYIRSDVNLKSNFEEITDALGRLRHLTGWIYDKLLKGGTPEKDVVKREAGLIAQDMQQAFSIGVERAPDGYLALSQSGTIALIVEAIKELDDKVEGVIRDRTK